VKSEESTVKSENCRAHGVEFLVSINVCISIYPPKKGSSGQRQKNVEVVERMK